MGKHEKEFQKIVSEYDQEISQSQTVDKPRKSRICCDATW